MRARKLELMSGLILTIAAAQTQAAVVNFSHDMNSKTGWTAVEGGESGYALGPDVWGNFGKHMSVTTATSQRQAFFDTPMNYGPGFSLEMKFRVMLHNTIAGVNEAVARVGMLHSGATPAAAGQILNAWVTLRRVGSIELAVQRRTDSIGGFETVVSTSSPVGPAPGLNGYEYADWSVTRDAAGLWTVDALSAYGEHTVHFSVLESTTATLGSLNKVWIQDVGNQWNGSETAVYWDSISVESNGTEAPEPVGLTLFAAGSFCILRRRW